MTDSLRDQLIASDGFGDALSALRADRAIAVVVEWLRTEEVGDLMAEATEQHHLTDTTDAMGNNACACGQWWDTAEIEGWDQHMAYGCVIIYVPRPEEIKRWAVRFGDEQRIWPNSEFMTRDGAERWGRSCAEMHGTPTLMRLVEHEDRLRGTWEDVGPIHHLAKTTGGTDG